MTATTMERAGSIEYLEALSGFWPRVNRPRTISVGALQQYALSDDDVITLQEQPVVIRLNVGRSHRTAPALRDFATALSRFIELPANWDGYGARPIANRAALKALEILSAILTPDARVPALIPTPRGGVQIEWHNSGYDVEIDVAPDGTVQSYVEHGDQERSWSNHQLPDDPAFRDALGAVLGTPL